MTNRKAHHRALQALLSRPWAIQREWFETMVAIAAGDHAFLEAIAKEVGQPLENVQNTTIREGVATMEITGPLFKHGGMLSRVSGATTYERLATDLTTVMEDPEVGAVIVAFDTPGGDVNGLLETADLMAGWAAGEKPFIAHVGGLGASAGYVLASATQEIVVSDLSIVGSLGVVKSIVDFRKQDAMEGIEEIEIVSSQSPKKRPDVKTKSGRAQHQREVDDIAAVIIERVARYRGIDVETVLADYGQGDVFIGQLAVDVGVAERVATYEDLHAELVTRVSGTTRPTFIPGSAAAVTEEDLTMKTNTDPAPAAAQTPEQLVAAFEAAHPDAAQLLIARTNPTDETAAREAGATAERERLLAIEQLAEPGYEALIAACKADPTCTPAMTALKMKEQERTGKSAHLTALEQDETENAFPTPSVGDSESATEEEQTAARVINAGRVTASVN